MSFLILCNFTMLSRASYKNVRIMTHIYIYIIRTLLNTIWHMRIQFFIQRILISLRKNCFLDFNWHLQCSKMLKMGPRNLLHTLCNIRIEEFFA